MSDWDAIERLRGFRVRPMYGGWLGDAIDREEKKLRRQERSTRGVGDAWVELLPAGLSTRCSLVGLRSGVLTVSARDSSARFELDRWLRSGGERDLVQASGVGVRRVKVVVVGEGT